MNFVGTELVERTQATAWPIGLGQRLKAAWAPLVLGGIVAVAGALRILDLGTKSLWFDETYSVYIAEQSLLGIPRLLRLFDTHPPLYYVLLHFWIALLGRSEVWVRILSVLASLGAVVLTWLLARRTAGPRVAVLAAVLLTISPFQVTAAQEARMYPFLMLFGLGASYALWLALEEGRRRYWIAYGICTLLALYTHHFALVLLVAQGIYVVAFHRARGAVMSWVVTTAGVAVAYAPLLPTLLTQLLTARGWPGIRPPFGLGALTDTLGLFSFGGGLFGMGTYFQRGALPLEYRGAILLPFVLLVLAGVGGLKGRQRSFLLSYWLLPILLVGAVSLKWNMFYERYFSFVIPAFSILVAAGIVTVAAAMRGPMKSGLAFVGLLALVASFNVPALVNLYRTGTPYDWRALAHFVRDNARTDDFILFVPAFARIPFEYYFEGPQKRMSVNPREVISANRQVRFKTQIDAGKFAAVARGHPRMWIIATIPIGEEARKEIAKILAPYFREVEGKSFGLVYAFRWESRVYEGSPGP